MLDLNATPVENDRRLAREKIILHLKRSRKRIASLRDAAAAADVADPIDVPPEAEEFKSLWPAGRRCSAYKKRAKTLPCLRSSVDWLSSGRVLPRYKAFAFLQKKAEEAQFQRGKAEADASNAKALADKDQIISELRASVADLEAKDVLDGRMFELVCSTAWREGVNCA